MHGGRAPLIAVLVLLVVLVAGGVFVFRSRAPEPAPSPTTTPVAPTTSPPPVFDEPPPPPPPPAETAAEPAVPAEPKAPEKRPALGGCAGECRGTAPPGFQGQLAAKGAASRGCYERALRQNPTLQGRMKVSIRVGPDGNVCRANVVSNELGDQGVAACVAQIFRSAAFSAPKGGCVDAEVPLKFSPKN